MKRIALGRISTIVATVFVAAGLAASASAAPSGSCPSLNQNLKTYSNVGAFFTNSGDTTTYTFFSATTAKSAERSAGPGQVLRLSGPGRGAHRARTVAAEGANGEPLDLRRGRFQLHVRAAVRQQEQHSARREDSDNGHRDLGHGRADRPDHSSPHRRQHSVQGPLRRQSE